MIGWLHFIRDAFSFLFDADKYAGRTFDRLQLLKIPDPPPRERVQSDISYTVRDESLGLEAEFYGRQADGKVHGYSLYFRARWNAWHFTVSLSPDARADCLDGDPDVHGFFRDGEYDGFYLTGRYPQASDMPLDTAKELLRDCARRFTDALSQARSHRPADEL